MYKIIFKYIIFIGLAFLVGYKSVYFKNLDQYKKASLVDSFDARGAAKDYLAKMEALAPTAVSLRELMNLLETNPDKAFKDYGKALGIGNIRYFLVQGKGLIDSVNESSVTISLADAEPGTKVTMATEFVFGNALRDASGLVKLEDFTSTMDLNNVAAEINRIIREDRLPAFKTAAKTGRGLSFTGAFELNQKQVALNILEIMPLSFTWTDSLP